MLNRIINLVNGYKTYIGAAIVFFAGGLHELCNVTFVNVCISDDVYKNLVTMGTAIAVVGIGHKLSKIKREV